MGAVLSKLYIALLIKENRLKIKNNSLDPYIYKAISTDRSRIKLTSLQDVCYFNQKSLFSNNAEFYTIIDSIYEWHDFIRDMLEIDVMQLSAHDIEFTAKIEDALNKIYVVLDDINTDLSIIEDKELKAMIESTLTTDELLENVITFIPNLSLYFALRELSFICSGLSTRMVLKSISIHRFQNELRSSKKKLLKAINLSEYNKDEKNEKMLQENPLT